MENKLTPVGGEIHDRIHQLKTLLKKANTVSYAKASEAIKKSLLEEGETEEAISTILKHPDVFRTITEFQADLKLIREMDETWCKLQIRKLVDNPKTKDLVKLGAIRTIWDWQKDILGDDIEEIAVEYFIEARKEDPENRDEDEGWEDDQED